jgi:LPS-assembly protein
MVMRKLMFFSAVTLSCFTTLTSAQTETSWQHCNVLGDVDFLPYVETTEASEVDVKADDAQLVENGTSVFTGNVEVNRSGQQLKANRATYDQNSGGISAQGDVMIRDSEIILNAEQGEWSMTDDKGTLIDAEYRLKEMHARGEASHVHRQGKTRTKLKSATYTTCSPGDDAWLLQASKVDLNHTEAVGSAQNVVVRLGGVPVFYTPYISFPLSDERKSGFLTPSLGSSDETGFDVSTPYYWNISPNMDATLTPRYMSDRGLLLSSEFRYLTDNSEGKLDAGFLGSDSLKNSGDDLNSNYHEDRKHFTWQNRSYLGRWSSNLDYNYVSDDEYLEDFGSNLSIASTTHLNRNLDVSYSGNNWNFLGRVQGYQTLTDVSKPYQRLPQLKLTALLPDQMMGMTYGLTTEYVDFDHDTNVAGQRFNIEPSVSLPWRSAAAFVTPRVALNHTRYDLDKNVTTNIDKTPTRTVPITSLDSGLFFERELSFAGDGFIQTLEPRAFYLYVPNRDQDDIPDFDTSLRTFNMGQLFSYDRFSGTDRIGDANQLSLALTSRFINQKTGRENVRLSLGQIRYFRDRKVSLGSTTYDANRSDSDMVAEMAASLAKQWTLRGEIQWNPHGNTSNMSALSLRYRGDNGSLFNVSHRYRRDNITSSRGLEQIDISTKVPINRQWNIVGRLYRSLKDTTTLETLAGIEYDSCCWASRLAVRDYVNDVSDDERNLAIFFPN